MRVVHINNWRRELRRKAIGFPYQNIISLMYTDMISVLMFFPKEGD